ncbi:uncharacterized protein LOC134203670 [Armigeres subalbatus]|uniref:uncharacterized protein LOC134203666 n=1 Tax=Armigeres subalbatus TaxID=124917 RepID=UPI002ED0D2CC
MTKAIVRPKPPPCMTNAPYDHSHRSTKATSFLVAKHRSTKAIVQPKPPPCMTNAPFDQSHFVPRRQAPFDQTIALQDQSTVRPKPSTDQSPPARSAVVRLVAGPSKAFTVGFDQENLGNRPTLPAIVQCTSHHLCSRWDT